MDITKEKPVIEQRDASIDVLNIISVFGVIVIHKVAGEMPAYPIGSFSWYLTVFRGFLTRFSVPVFFMCTGAVLLSPEKHMSIKKLYSKYIVRTVATLFFGQLPMKYSTFLY